MKAVFCTITLLAMAHLGSPVTCPHPFLSVGSGCYYILPDTNVDWIRAFAICSLDYKGYLAEITDQQEQDNIADWIKRTDPQRLYHYYIGATDSQQEGSFRWMMSGNYIAYSNWHDGEPNNFGGEEHCVYLYPYNKWNNFKCSRRINFDDVPLKALCEANPVEPPNTCSKLTCNCTNDIMPSAGMMQVGKEDVKMT